MASIIRWTYPAKRLVILVWIVFPFVYSFLLYSLSLFFGNQTIGDPLIGVPEYEIVHNFSILIPPLPVIIWLLVFAIYPAIYSSRKFFSKRGFENVVVEFLYLRRLLYLSLIAVVYIIFAIVGLILLILEIIPISILVKLFLQLARTEFKVLFAKACFKMALNEDIDNPQKARYLRLGFQWYNAFLKKHLGLQIKNIDVIYSRIMLGSSLTRNEQLSLIKSFDDEDDFAPLRHIALDLFEPDGEILSKGSLKMSIVESSKFVIPVITTIITVVSTFFLKPSH